MDIFNNSSVDIPYEDTNYVGILASSDISIRCAKILTKRYEDSTYFKLELPLGAVISTDDNITLTLDRDDSYRLTDAVKITNNIIRIKTTEISWIKWVDSKTSKAFGPNKEFLNQLERLSQTQQSLGIWQSDRTIRPDGPNVVGYDPNQSIRFVSNGNTISTSLTGHLRSDIDGDNVHSAAYDVNNPF